MIKRRSGFTLLEILIAIGIIVILAAMFIGGFKAIGNHSRKNATKTSLENCKAMLTELEVTATLASLPPAAITAPTDLNEGGIDRYGDAVMQTNRVMTSLLRVPANKKVFQQLPPAQLAIPQWQALVNYEIGDRLQYNKNYYRCIIQHQSAAGNVPPSGNWVADTAATPLILDAWNNPIIFAPTRGMAGVVTTGTVNATAWSSGTTYASGQTASIVVSGRTLNYVCIETHVAAVGNAPPAASNWAGDTKAVDNRPFFASAGADGIMSVTIGADNTYWTADDMPAGDDNIYSFEN